MELFYQNAIDRYKFSHFHDMAFPAHLHSNLECIWLKQGEMLVTVNNYCHTMTAGEMFLAFPHQIHQYQTESGKSCEGIMVIYPVAACGDYLKTLAQNHPEFPFLLADTVHPDVIYVLESLLKVSLDIRNQLPVVHAYMHLLLAHTVPFLSLQKNKDSQPLGQTALLIQYVSEHYTDPISLDSLAAELHVSKYCISRIFSEKLHTSLSRYINTLRIDLAKTLLLKTDLDILSISEHCGYDTPRTFNRVFRTLCDYSPREYRKSVFTAQT